jgi:hypothetical protein
MPTKADDEVLWQKQRQLALDFSAAFLAMTSKEVAQADCDDLRAAAQRLEQDWFSVLTELGFKELPRSAFPG